MGKLKLLISLFMLILCINVVSAATIQGTIYDFSLEKMDNVVIEIDSQRYLSTDGTYMFTVEPGPYMLTATYVENSVTKLVSSDDVDVNGNMVFDIFLFPYFGDEDEMLNHTGLDFTYDTEEPAKSQWIYVGIIILLAVLLIANIFRNTLKKAKKVEHKEDLNSIVDIIKKHGGRTTQKEIRKEIPLSEAKVSLMIAELEHRGMVKKIKKGRGNIVIFEK